MIMPAAASDDKVAYDKRVTRKYYDDDTACCALQHV